jgi:hypothetical protein
VKRRGLIIAAIVISSPFVLYFGARAADAFLGHGYTLTDMDWNGDGYTTPAEVIRGSDVGERPSPTGCREFFDYKDGLPIKTVCPTSSGISN